MRFIILLAIGLASFTANLSAETNAPKSRVVLVRNPAVFTDLRVNPPVARTMVAVGIKTLTGETNEAAAWQQLFSSNDVVGIKISTLASPAHVTHQALIDAIADGLQMAGVAATNIIVFDRDPKRLDDAQYVAHSFRLTPIIGKEGWDPEAFIESPLVGKLIWGDLEFVRVEALSNRSHLPKLLTHTLTKLINVPVLMDHEATGIANCLYNISLGMTDNQRRFEQNGQRGDPAIPELCSLPAVRTKLVLNICDALVAGYAGGPAFKPQFSWMFGGLYFSHDPVAIDALCLDQLDNQRHQDNLPPIGIRASHVKTAAHAGLGQARLDQIELLESTPRP